MVLVPTRVTEGRDPFRLEAEQGVCFLFIVVCAAAARVVWVGVSSGGLV